MCLRGNLKQADRAEVFLSLLFVIEAKILTILVLLRLLLPLSFLPKQAIISNSILFTGNFSRCSKRLQILRQLFPRTVQVGPDGFTKFGSKYRYNITSVQCLLGYFGSLIHHGNYFSQSVAVRSLLIFVWLLGSTFNFHQEESKSD